MGSGTDCQRARAQARPSRASPDGSQVHAKARAASPADSGRPDDVNAVIQCYPASIGKVFQTDERSIKRDLTVRSLRELGIRNEGRVLEHSRADTYADLMRGKERYVVLVRDGQLEGVIDRVDLASRMAAGGM